MIFRFKALQKMREPDELDSPTLLAAPRGWIAVFVVGFVLLAGGAWAVVGRIPVSVSAPGLLTYAGGTLDVQTPDAGTVQRLLVHVGQQIAVGTPLAEIKTADGTNTLPSPFAGTVVSQQVSDAAVVERGTSLLTVERRQNGQPMVALLFVPESVSVTLKPGQSVTLSVSTAPAQAYGLLRATVTTISPFALTAAEVADLVGGQLAAEPYLTGGAPHLVSATLDKDGATASGLAWTTAAGPPTPIRSQTQVHATVTLGGQAPLSLLFG